MPKLNIDATIRDIINDEPLFSSFNNEDIEAIKRIYNSVENDELNINKTFDEKQSLVSAIMLKYSYGEDEQLIMSQHSKNKHISYFYNFLGEKEAKKLIEELSKRGYSADILKGLRRDENFDAEIGNIKIHQKMSEYSDQISYGVEVFEIYDENGLIFSYNPNNNTTEDGMRKVKTFLRRLKTSENVEYIEQGIKNGRTIYRNSAGRIVSKKSLGLE